jgi:uncharacterized protein (TIGR02996 family)
MSTEPGLIEAIRQQPADNALRLVFADWLEEHGRTERAEFIRLQVALADPPDDWAEYRALRAREAALVKQHGQKWFGPLKKLGVSQWHLRRGLISRVTMTGRKFLEHGEQLLAMTPVHSIHLRQVRPVLSELAASPLLGRLIDLGLLDNKLNDAAIEVLVSSPHLSGLRNLDLSDNPLGPDSMETLTGSSSLRGLRRLALRNTQIGFEGVRPLVGHIDYPQVFEKTVNMPGLVALDLRDNTIHEEGVTVLGRSPHMACLRELSLSNMWPKDGESLTWRTRLRNLEILRISGRYFFEGIGCVLTKDFASQLQALELSDTGAADYHAEQIARCPYLTGLRHLNLSSNRITDAGLEALASSGQMPHLRWLDLSHNQITSAGVRALCASPLARQLRELNLSANAIDNEGARAIAACPQLTRLHGLDLSSNQIKNRGASALAGSPIMQHLEWLSLLGNPIDEAGIERLARTAKEVGLTRRMGSCFWVEPRWSRGEPFRETGWDYGN